MTVENVLVSKNYTVAGGNDTYAIPFDFIDVDTVLVYVDSVLQTYGEEEDYTRINFTTDDRGNYLPTSIQFTTAGQPANGSIVTVSRSSDITQTEDFLDGDEVPQDNFEYGLDKLTLIIQEVSNRIARAIALPEGSELSPLEFPEPGAGEYIKWNAGGTALETAAIDLTTIQANIVTLQNTVNSLQSQITSNDNDITSIEIDTAAATAAVLALTGVVSALDTRVGINEAAITALQNAATALALRVSALELVNGVRSSQVINNDQTTSEDLTDFVFDGDVYDYALVDYIINRKTDSNYLSEVGTLHLVMRPNMVWTFENGLQLVDIAGVTFTITTSAGNVGTLSYTSTDVAGTSYVGKMRYTIKKFEV